MKRGSTIFLRLAIIAIGIVVLLFCIFAVPVISKGIVREFFVARAWEYGYMIGAYASAIPFYIALYHSMKLLHYIDTNKAFSESSIRSLKVIKYCAVVVCVIYLAGLPLFYQIAQVSDAPGAMAIGMMFAGAPMVLAVFTGVLEMLLKNAIDIQAENELTV